MRFSILLIISFMFAFVNTASSQSKKKEKEKITPIDRAVEGEIITFKNDTLWGKIKIKNAEDYYITSIIFKDNNGYKRKYTAYDVRWFKQAVPFPDREAFGVDTVFFKSGPHPDGENKKVFLPNKE